MRLSIVQCTCFWFPVLVFLPRSLFTSHLTCKNLALFQMPPSQNHYQLWNVFVNCKCTILYGCIYIVNVLSTVSVLWWMSVNILIHFSALPGKYRARPVALPNTCQRRDGSSSLFFLKTSSSSAVQFSSFRIIVAVTNI